MTPGVFSLYDATTGLFLDRGYEGPASGILAFLTVLPETTSFILGKYDHLSQRVDLETGEVVDYVPPQPGPRYVWQPDTKRWVYTAGDAEALWMAQDAAMHRINLYYAEQLAGVRYGYPSDEVASWAKQETEARAWTANNAAPTPLLSAIAAARGVPFDVLVTKVIEKADMFAAASGDLIGSRQRAEDQIAAAADPAAVEAIVAQLLAT